MVVVENQVDAVNLNLTYGVDHEIIPVGFAVYSGASVVGDKDTLKPMNVELDKELSNLGIAHHFEQYEGDHGNRVASRFQNNLLHFFPNS